MQTSHKRRVLPFFLVLISNLLFSQTEIVDLALRETSTVTTYSGSGQEIEFTITIFNQGNIPLTNIGLINYVPTQMILSTTNPNGWSSGANGLTAAKIFTETLLPGDSAKISVFLVTKSGVTGTIKNTAEITSIQDLNFVNRTLDEIDSTPDGFNTEINVKDDVINENGFISGQDEDDHDISYVYAVPNPFAFKTVRWYPASGNTSNTPRVGDTLIYTVAAFNTGPGVLDNFNIVDTLPYGVQRDGVSNLRATGGSNASLNSTYGQSSHVVLKRTDATQTIKLKANGYLYVNLRVLIKPEALGLTLSNQAWLQGTNTVFLSDAKDSITAPSILIDPIRPELRQNVLKSFLQNSQTDALDPTLILVSTTLPIEELNYFQATRNKSSVVLNWKTTQEKIAGYGIERSRDGLNFESIGNIPAKNLYYNTYSFVDNYPFSNINYYRLKIQEVDGNFSYSSVISIHMDILGESNLKVFPNPSFNQDITVFCENLISGDYLLEISNLSGYPLYSGKHNVFDDYFYEKLSLPENVTTTYCIVKLTNIKTNHIKSFLLLNSSN